MVNPPVRRGDQSLTVICKCSAGHVGWDMPTGRHPAPYAMLLSYLVVGLPFRLLQLCLKGSNGIMSALLVNR